MLNEQVCRAYVNNAYDRRHTVARWHELFEAMPIGVPMTAAEIAEKANENVTGYYPWTKYGARSIPPMARAMGYSFIKKSIKHIPPYTIKVGGHWDYVNEEWVLVDQKDKVIDTVTIYTRLK